MYLLIQSFLYELANYFSRVVFELHMVTSITGGFILQCQKYENHKLHYIYHIPV